MIRPNTDRSSTDRSSNVKQATEDEHLAFSQALNAMVDKETEHIHEGILTDKIVRAVNHSSSAPWWIDELFSGALVSWFRPVAVIGMLLILILAAYNIANPEPTSYERSTAERFFGMHPVTLATAYDLDLTSTPEKN